MGYTPPWLRVFKSAAATTVSPSDTSTQLDIVPNATGTILGGVVSGISLQSNGDLGLYVKSGRSLTVYNAASEVILSLSYATPDCIFTSETNKNIYLKTQGTGMVKFGTYDATAALASVGFIPILDAAGNTRKLMVQA